MKNSNKKIINSMKILGMGLLFLAIPGSTLYLPWLIHQIKNNKVKEEPNTILGI